MTYKGELIGGDTVTFVSRDLGLVLVSSLYSFLFTFQNCLKHLLNWHNVNGEIPPHPNFVLMQNCQCLVFSKATIFSECSARNNLLFFDSICKPTGLCIYLLIYFDVSKTAMHVALPDCML